MAREIYKTKVSFGLGFQRVRAYGGRVKKCLRPHIFTTTVCACALVCVYLWEGRERENENAGGCTVHHLKPQSLFSMTHLLIKDMSSNPSQIVPTPRDQVFKHSILQGTFSFIQLQVPEDGFVGLADSKV